MTRPYIPTAEECGVVWRVELGLGTVEQARATEHLMRGSFINNWCYLCEQAQSATVHGIIHHISAGEFACGLTSRIPLAQRTVHPERTTCPGCLAALAAGER